MVELKGNISEAAAKRLETLRSLNVDAADKLTTTFNTTQDAAALDKAVIGQISKFSKVASFDAGGAVSRHAARVGGASPILSSDSPLGKALFSAIQKTPVSELEGDVRGGHSEIAEKYLLNHPEFNV